MLEEKLVLAKSPALPPRPVKSKRSTPKPRSTKAAPMRDAASVSLEHVKQCANNAKADGAAAGKSSRPARRAPEAPGKRTIVGLAFMFTPPSALAVDRNTGIRRAEQSRRDVARMGCCYYFASRGGSGGR